MIVITQLFYAGTPEEAAERKDSFYVNTAEEAFHTMCEGATAFIPLDGWEATAEAVLEQFGSTPENTHGVILFAKIGSYGEVTNGEL